MCSLMVHGPSSVRSPDGRRLLGSQRWCTWTQSGAPEKSTISAMFTRSNNYMLSLGYKRTLGDLLYTPKHTKSTTLSSESECRSCCFVRLCSCDLDSCFVYLLCSTQFLCRVSKIKHLAKSFFAECFLLPRVFEWHSTKSFFIECPKKTLDKIFGTRQRAKFR
jgi:hypothetical protein